MEHQRLYVVDNSSYEQTVKRYLTEWCQVSKQMDIATGYFEIGGLLDLDQNWQKLDKIRIILGSEMTKRTKDVIDMVVKAMLSRLKESVDKEQEHNEFLIGVPAVVEAMKSRKIECRVYDNDKFHAKAYITWLVMDNNTIVDITGDQFAVLVGFNEEVYVGKKNSFYKRLERERKQISENYNIVQDARLWNDYKIIMSYVSEKNF